MTTNKWIVSAIAALSLVLRIYQLGAQSFWFDEAGVATAAVSPTLAGAIEIARSHAGAMPLDYVVAWIMAHLSIEESWLRLPSAVWGVLTILVAFQLFKELAGEKAAIVGIFLMALSPLLVYYSRELRFYAALCFFYTSLTYLLLKALKTNTSRSWVWTGIVAVVGFYFHIYVVLAFLTGVILYFLAFRNKNNSRLLLKNLLITAFLVGLFCLPGYLYFAQESPTDYVLDWNHLAYQIILGFGWFPYYFTQVGLFFTFLVAIFSIGGWIQAFHLRDQILISLIISTIIQAAIIVIIDILMSYFFAGRQFIILLPINYLFAGWMISRLWERQTPLIQFGGQTVHNGNLTKINRAFLILTILVLSGSGFMTYVQDSNQVKSNGREISQILHIEWQNESKVWVVPFFEPLLYEYYLENRFMDTRITPYFSGINWVDINTIPHDTGYVFLITPPLRGYEDLAAIENLGFVPHAGFDYLSASGQILWVRE